MCAKIGLISTQLLFPPILQALSAAGLEAEITPLEYRRMAELPEIYRAHREAFDGFCITGSVAREIILRTRAGDSKPLASLSGRTVEYYQEFFRLISENRAIDFSRVLLDSYLWLGGSGPRTVADFLQRRFPIEKKQAAVTATLPMERLEQAEELILDGARRLFAQGGLDLVVCRFSTAYQVLQAAGLPCSFVYPDPDNILDTFTLLLRDIKLDQLSDNLPAVIFLTSPLFQEGLLSDVSADSVGLQKCLLEFDQEYTTGFVIKRAAGGLELYTTQQVARRITDNFTACQLRTYMFSRLGLELNIGYGIGRDIMRAREHALDACAASQRSGQSCAVTQDGCLIGPMDTPSSHLQPAELSPRAVQAADRSGLSGSTIQRIASVSQLLGSNDLTTQELANSLQVTVANANRFLNALVKGGQAHIAAEKRGASKGRPRRVYHLDFLD